MLELSLKQMQLLNLLSEQTEPLSSNFFASNLATSSRTIRTDMMQMNEVITRYGARIDGKTGAGYLLQITDNAKFDGFFREIRNELKSDAAYSVSLNTLRAHFVIRYLLCKGKDVKIEKIEKRLFLNRTTVISIINQVKKMLAEFDLKVVTKNKHGLHIEGEEHNKRACLNYECNFYLMPNLHINEEDPFIEYFCPAEIEKSLSAIILEKHNDYDHSHLSDYSVQYIARAIYIAYIRNEKKLYLDYDKETIEKYFSSNDYYVAKAISRSCGEFLQHDFKEEDLISLTINLEANKVILSVDDLPYEDGNVDVRNVAFDLVQYLESVNNFKHLGKDVKLINILSLNLKQMITRMQYHLKTTIYLNSEDYSIQAHKMAIQTAAFLNDRFKVMLDEGEIYRLALIFYPVFGRYRLEFRKLNVIIVSQVDKNISKGMEERLRRNFSNRLDVIESYYLYELPNVDFSKFDVIVSSYPPETFDFVPDHIEILDINMFFGDDVKLALKNRFNDMVSDSEVSIAALLSEKICFENIKARNKEECLMEIARIVEKQEGTIPGVYESLKAVEDISATKEKNNLVFITPIQGHTASVFVGVFILEKPKTWTKEKVQIVVYWDGETDVEDSSIIGSDFISHIIKDVFGDKQIINTILKKEDYGPFYLALKQAYSQILLNSNNMNM